MLLPTGLGNFKEGGEIMLAPGTLKVASADTDEIRYESRMSPGTFKTAEMVTYTYTSLEYKQLGTELPPLADRKTNWDAKFDWPAWSDTEPPPPPATPAE